MSASMVESVALDVQYCGPAGALSSDVRSGNHSRICGPRELTTHWQRRSVFDNITENLDLGGRETLVFCNRDVVEGEGPSTSEEKSWNALLIRSLSRSLFDTGRGGRKRIRKRRRTDQNPDEDDGSPKGDCDMESSDSASSDTDEELFLSRTALETCESTRPSRTRPRGDWYNRRTRRRVEVSCQGLVLGESAADLRDICETKFPNADVDETALFKGKVCPRRRLGVTCVRELERVCVSLLRSATSGPCTTSQEKGKGKKAQTNRAAGSARQVSSKTNSSLSSTPPVAIALRFHCTTDIKIAPSLLASASVADEDLVDDNDYGGSADQFQVGRVSQTGVLTCLFVDYTSFTAAPYKGSGGVEPALQALLTAIASGDEISANLKRRTELNHYLVETLQLTNERSPFPKFCHIAARSLEQEPLSARGHGTQPKGQKDEQRTLGTGRSRLKQPQIGAKGVRLDPHQFHPEIEAQKANAEAIDVGMFQDYEEDEDRSRGPALEEQDFDDEDDPLHQGAPELNLSRYGSSQNWRPAADSEELIVEPSSAQRSSRSYGMEIETLENGQQMLEGSHHASASPLEHLLLSDEFFFDEFSRSSSAHASRANLESIIEEEDECVLDHQIGFGGGFRSIPHDEDPEAEPGEGDLFPPAGRDREQDVEEDPRLRRFPGRPMGSRSSPASSCFSPSVFPTREGGRAMFIEGEHAAAASCVGGSLEEEDNAGFLQHDDLEMQVDANQDSTSRHSGRPGNLQWNQVPREMTKRPMLKKRNVFTGRGRADGASQHPHEDRILQTLLRVGRIARVLGSSSRRHSIRFVFLASSVDHGNADFGLPGAISARALLSTHGGASSHSARSLSNSRETTPSSTGRRGTHHVSGKSGPYSARSAADYGRQRAFFLTAGAFLRTVNLDRELKAHIERQFVVEVPSHGRSDLLFAFAEPEADAQLKTAAVMRRLAKSSNLPDPLRLGSSLSTAVA
ncbi:unnamed protein product, partial [Amoebophrya sp. A25]|eukprot:GSA25T00022661001.1